MRATKSMHVDATPEQVFSFLLDSTFTPPGMAMEAVHESQDDWATHTSGPSRCLACHARG